MARRSREAGTIKLGILSAALIAGSALPALADDNKLTLTGSASFTTDYIFRGLSDSARKPAVQPEFDLTYGIFYGYIWGSNDDLGQSGGQNISGGIEIDYGVGITPMWKGITFNIAGLYYTFPGALDLGGEADFFELRTGASYTFAKKLTLSVNNYWSPEFFGGTGNADAIEGSAAYAFDGKLFNFFSPSISGGVGTWQFVNAAIPDYTYWNAGLTLGFLEHWSADVRYYDTDLNTTGCFTFIGAQNSCGASVVGTIKATF